VKYVMNGSICLWDDAMHDISFMGNKIKYGHKIT